MQNAQKRIFGNHFGKSLNNIIQRFCGFFLSNLIKINVERFTKDSFLWTLYISSRLLLKINPRILQKNFPKYFSKVRFVDLLDNNLDDILKTKSTKFNLWTLLLLLLS